MKFILLTILSTIIVFFVWNILKRIFFTNFYGNRTAEHQKRTDHRSSRSKINQKVNWDAETVDYEEVKEEKNDKK